MTKTDNFLPDIGEIFDYFPQKNIKCKDCMVAFFQTGLDKT